MKLRLPLALLLSLPALPGLAQTTLTNDGATITVQSGAMLYVQGHVQNTSGSTLTNVGTVQLTGDLTNGGTFTSTGQLQFSGSDNQVFTPGAATVTNLTLNNTGASGQRTLSIPADLTITDELTLVSGLVRTAPVGATTPLATLTLANGARITGEAAGQYVQGRLRVVRTGVSGSSVDFSHGLVLDTKGQALGTVAATRTAGLQEAGVSFGQNVDGTHQGIDRVWDLEAASAPAQPVAVTLRWVSDDDHGIDLSQPAQLWRAATAAGPWERQGAAGSVATRRFTAEVKTLGVLTVSSTSAPLPVELLRFTAEPLGADAAQLRWSTATEKNSAYFEVEGSADGRSYRRVSRVAGHGTTTQQQQYALVDEGISRYATALVYYRLRQVDQDGTTTLSPVRTVKVVRSAQLALFPNPTTGAATLTGARPGEAVTVFDAVGRQVLQLKTTAAGTAALQLPNGVAMGLYVVRVGVQALPLIVAQ